MSEPQRSVKDFAGSDCAANQAEISVISTKFKPKGFLMGLATDMRFQKECKIIAPNADGY